MEAKVLITSTSFFDAAGKHQSELAASGLQYFNIRGPLKADALIQAIHEHGPFDAILCGEDEVNAAVIEALRPRLKVISKFGVGIDRIDVVAAGKAGVLVTNTPGVNHHSVAELTFGLLLSLVRHIPTQNSLVHAGQWRRMIGTELAGKTLGIIGVGRVGKEVALRALAFGLQVVGFNSSWPKAQMQWVQEINSLFSHPAFSERAPRFRHVKSIEQLLEESDYISLHMNLTRDNAGFIDSKKLALCKRGVVIVNVSRAALIDTPSLVEALRNGQVGGYGTDVLMQEPISEQEPLRGLSNVLITPHVGSRTVESVERQGLLALQNVLQGIRNAGDPSSWPQGAVCVLPKSAKRADSDAAS